MTLFSDLLWLDVSENWWTIQNNQTNWTDVHFNDCSTSYWDWNRDGRGLFALSNRLTTITCANVFPQVSIYLATKFVEKRLPYLDATYSPQFWQSTANNGQHLLQQYYQRIQGSHRINQRRTNVNLHFYSWIIQLFIHWSSLQKPTTSFDQKPRRNVFDDHYVSRDKQRIIHCQVLNQQSYY